MAGEQPSHPGRENLKPWKKGQSGNPGGKRKDEAEIKAECRHLSHLVLKKIKGLLVKDKLSPRDLIEVWKAVTDRGWGPVRAEAGDSADLPAPVSITIVAAAQPE